MSTNWPYCVEIDDEIEEAIPKPRPAYLKYDVYIRDNESCETFVKLNGEAWRKCAELILSKYKMELRK